MKKTLLGISVVVAMLLSSCCGDCGEGKSCAKEGEKTCAHKDGKTCSHEEKEDDNHEEGNHEEHTNEAAKLLLNNGEKWDANSETTTGMANMLALTTNETPDASVQTYTNLSSKLQNELNMIIDACNMEGAAHDQLHNFLMPLIAQIDELKEVNSVEDGKKITEELKQHLETYLNYFK